MENWQAPSSPTTILCNPMTRAIFLQSLPEHRLTNPRKRDYTLALLYGGKSSPIKTPHYPPIKHQESKIG